MQRQIRSLGHAILFIVTLAFRTANASNARGQRVFTTYDAAATTIVLQLDGK